MHDFDPVFKALGDPSRRMLLDRLNAQSGQTLSQLRRDLPLTRQAVSKHLVVLEAAGLVAVRRRGREKLHFLNTAPINAIADRWISRYHRERARTLADLQHVLEETPMSRTDFVYVTYIRTTPDRLWQALTEPQFIRRYFGGGPESDWRVGSPVRWRMDANDELHDWGQKVLESDPPRRLVYTWHTYQPEMARIFGWNDEKLAELQKERISKVSFEIEPVGPVTRLTVIHDDFEPNSEMLKGISAGWPMILSQLKSLLEVDEPVSSIAAQPA